MTFAGPTTEALPGIRRRLASMGYECLLVLAVLCVGFLLPHLVLGIGYGIALPGYLLIFHVVLLLALYFIGYWRYSGQTLAMQTWKIKLTGTDAASPASTLLVLRFLLAWPSILLYGVGIIWALFDRDRQFLHDRLAGTRIMHQDKVLTALHPPN